MNTEAITIPDDCPPFNTCSANLCPYDPQIKERVWYPNETVCAKQNMTEKFPWIKAQRKIARRCKDKNKYFVVEMLMNLSSVRKGTVGLSPDVSHQRQLNSWLKDHHKAKKREYTEEEKRTLTERLEKGKKLKKVDSRGQITFKF